MQHLLFRTKSTRIFLLFLAVFFVSSLTLLASPPKPLLEFKFNGNSPDSAENSGTLGGDGDMDAKGVAMPERVEGFTGNDDDLALYFPDEQINTTNKHTKFSRVQYKIGNKMDNLKEWTLTMMLTFPIVDDPHERVLFSNVTEDKSGGITVVYGSLETPQLAVKIKDKAAYTAPFGFMSRGDTPYFIAITVEDGKASIYGAELDGDLKKQQQDLDVKEESTGKGNEFVFIGSQLTPFANQWGASTALDNVCFWDKALDQEDLQEILEEQANP